MEKRERTIIIKKWFPLAITVDRGATKVVIGEGFLPHPGNSVSNDLSTSRTGWIPFLNKDRCIHCGLCDVVCPDHCLVWKVKPAGDVRLEGVDYRYCKGCLRCVETCSTGAFQKKAETPGLADRLRVPLFEETGRIS